uniref:Uncharacterized protein n=1 Tax=Anguilla anguilla TaxID=7936 RepID=A0A0E9TY63_ANGAN
MFNIVCCKARERDLVGRPRYLQRTDTYSHILLKSNFVYYG